MTYGKISSERFRLPPTGPAADFRQHQQARDRAQPRPQRRPPTRVRHILQQLPPRLQVRRLPARLRLLRRPLLPLRPQPLAYVQPQRVQPQRLRLPRLVRRAPGAPAAPHLRPVRRLMHRASETARVHKCLGPLQGGPHSACPSASAGSGGLPARTSPGAPTPHPPPSPATGCCAPPRADAGTAAPGASPATPLADGTRTRPAASPPRASHRPRHSITECRPRPANCWKPRSCCSSSRYSSSSRPKHPDTSRMWGTRAALRGPSLLLTRKRGDQPAPAPHSSTACLLGSELAVRGPAAGEARPFRPW